jgi:predicted dehydrogenase
MGPLGVGVVGCGFVADYYMSSIRQFRSLRPVGAFDRDGERLSAFSGFHGVRRYASLEELLGDGEVEAVVNLTSPASHAEVTAAALGGGKHVYSEKPLAGTPGEAEGLMGLAAERGKFLAGAPCCALGETAQALWREVRRGTVGTVRMVRVHVDDGPLHLAPFARWRSASGAPWPARDEAALGSVTAHAAYGLCWLAMMFGPVREVAGLSGRVVPPGTLGGDDRACGPDVAFASMRMESGLMARVSCGTVSPRDRSFAVYGDRGVLEAGDCTDDRCPVYFRKYVTFRRRLVLSPWRRRIALPESGVRAVRYHGSQRRHFARGIDDLAAAVRSGRAPRLSGDFLLHVNELVHALAGAGTTPHRMIASGFRPVAPMDWAAEV